MNQSTKAITLDTDTEISILRISNDRIALLTFASDCYLSLPTYEVPSEIHKIAEQEFFDRLSNDQATGMEIHDFKNHFETDLIRLGDNLSRSQSQVESEQASAEFFWKVKSEYSKVLCGLSCLAEDPLIAAKSAVSCARDCAYYHFFYEAFELLQTQLISVQNSCSPALHPELLLSHDSSISNPFLEKNDTQTPLIFGSKFSRTDRLLAVMKSLPISFRYLLYCEDVLYFQRIIFESLRVIWDVSIPVHETLQDILVQIDLQLQKKEIVPHDMYLERFIYLRNLYEKHDLENENLFDSEIQQLQHQDIVFLLQELLSSDLQISAANAIATALSRYQFYHFREYVLRTIQLTYKFQNY